jgi:phosphodiesterase/alkaline phosphatase D-like protein
VFLTGDWHSTFVNDLKLDFKDPGADTIATEFVTPAITTGGDGTPYAVVTAFCRVTPRTRKAGSNS